MLKDLKRDFQDLIKSLTDQHVEFLIVGAHALAFHGVARYTQHLDIWMRRTEENARKLDLTLADFGLPISDADVQQMHAKGKFRLFGHEQTRVEILNFLDGCDYEEASARASHELLGGIPVSILGLEDYVATKVASGRPKDASDLILLRSKIGPLPGDSESSNL